MVAAGGSSRVMSYVASLTWLLVDMPIVLAVVTYFVTARFGLFAVGVVLMILSTTYLGGTLFGLPLYLGLATGMIVRARKPRSGWI